MAKKKEETTKKELSAEEKMAKKKARLEAIKNRPDGQRPNGKQVDVIQFGDNKEVRNYGTVIKSAGKPVGVLVTSVVVVDNTPVSTSVNFVPGNLTVKSKKGHGTILKYKGKAGKDKSETED